MQLGKTIRNYFTPTKENVYRPHLLGKGWLVFFLMFSMALEGFLVSGIVVRSSDGTFMTSAQQAIGTQTAAAITMQNVESFIRHILRIVGDPKVVNSLLGTVGALLMVVVVLTFVTHIDVQSHEALAGGVVVAALALLILVANIHFLSSMPLTAAGISALAP